MSGKKSFHHGDLKRVLFDVALALLDRDGVDSVTIRAVAREAGVSHGAPVNHYRDRKALLTALVQRQFETILSSIEANLSTSADGSGAWVEVFGQAMLDFGFKYPHRYRLLWRGDLIDQEDPDLLTVMDQIYDQLGAEIERTMPLAACDRDTVAIALWSMIHGYLDMRLSGMFMPQDDKVTGKPRDAALLEFFQLLVPQRKP